MYSKMSTVRGLAMVCVLLFSSLVTTTASAASSDVVLEWNALTTTTILAAPNPFAQARFGAITQLAVFEAVNAATGDYEPYLGTIHAPDGASAEAAAVAASYAVLINYFPASAATLDPARAKSLAAIADGTAKTDGIAVGVAVAAAMIAVRADDGSAPSLFRAPGAAAPGVWRATPSCPTVDGIQRGVLYNWKDVTPFGIPSAADFIPGPPPSLTSNEYAKDYLEVMTVGGTGSTARPQDRTAVARFYAATSPTYLMNSAARQVAAAKGDSLSENARGLALLNMAISDSLVASFATKYTYNFWRPETAIHASGAAFVPFIATPCFPSYPSNHASGSNGGAEVLRRLYGAGGHDITLTNPAVAGVSLQYTTFKQITDDIDDARVYGGIHFRFEQEAGGRMGREIATYVTKHNLQK
jgi:hypothetical protein